MTGKILLISHMPGERRDRAHKMLQARGLEIEWCAPALGDALPNPDEDRYAAVVVYGGSQSANDGRPDRAYIEDEIAWIRRWTEREKPYLGFCLGAQLLSRAWGGKVAPHPEGLHEIGFAQVENCGSSAFIPNDLAVYHWHIEGFDLPAGAELLLRGSVFPNQAMRMGPKIYGLQFHPEVTIEQMEHWMTEADHMLDLPGAHPRERQRQDAARHNKPLGEWLEAFFDEWLATAGALSPSANRVA